MRGPHMFLVGMVMQCSVALAGTGTLQIIPIDRDGGKGVAVQLGTEVGLVSPEEGLWSVATGWQERWPQDWQHAHATQVTQVNDWTVLTGAMTVGSGVLKLRDAYRLDQGLIRGIRRFTWTGDQSLEQVTLSVRFHCSGHSKGLFLPGICYYGNPSGEKSGRTPTWHGQSGEIALYEEHRYPMPLAALEWETDQDRVGAALHSLPCPVPGGDLPDQWWSLGAWARSKGTELTLLSGPCASNGQKGVIKAYQGKQRGSCFAEYDGATLTLRPGETIEKTFWLEAYPVARQGAGFQRPVHSSLKIFKPAADPSFPGLLDITRRKFSFAKTRWLEGENYAGFNQFGTEQECIVWGWVGQAAAPGYALQVLQSELQDRDIPQLVQKSLDFVSTTSFYEQGFYTWYHVDKQAWGERLWRPDPELLSQGQGMFNIANAIRVGRDQGRDTATWEAFLKRACDFHAQRLLKRDWKPKSTDEGFLIAPLCKAADLFDNEIYGKAAIKAGLIYANRHLFMEEPYWGGTLDASCEDKEGAFAALQGFLALYEMTGEKRYLGWARHAGDVCLSYVVVWDIDLPAGRLRDHNFKTRGWTAVSVQNMHIDVYGVLIAPDIYRLGQIQQDRSLQDLALLMVRSCGQLIDPWGSQGEQPQQTHYSQGKVGQGDWRSYRGDYVEDWTVFWITAHFLNASAQLKELGVGIE